MKRLSKADFAVSRRWWRTGVTIEKLLFLKAFDRLE